MAWLASLPRSIRAAVTSAAAAVLSTLLLTPATAETALEAQSRALTRASQALVGIEVQALADARSAATLGRERQGSGVVIGDDGLVLTAGFLILEAESVDLVLDDGRRLPARVVAWDAATGFGLVQALAPLGRLPVPLGDPAALQADEPLTVASGGLDGAVSAARLRARRAFAGPWEYAIEGALFTHPPRRDIGGAGLFNARGELLGIGALFLALPAGQGAARAPANLFVPVDLLRPVLAEMRQRGRSQASERAWLGVNCTEDEGEVIITRVAEDSPADAAGLEPGDRILRIDGVAVADLGTLWKTLWAGSGSEREVQLEILREGQRQTLRVQTVDRAWTLRRAGGV